MGSSVSLMGLSLAILAYGKLKQDVGSSSEVIRRTVWLVEAVLDLELDLLVLATGP